MSQITGTEDESSSNPQPADSAENDATKTDSQQGNQEKTAEEEKDYSEEPSQKKQTPAEQIQQENVPDKSMSASQSESSKKSSASDKMRRAFLWTMTSFFDWNPYYLLQMRGLMNILHVILSLTNIIIMGASCQLRAYPDSPTEGFFCKAPETFLFVITCCSFIISSIYLCCCLLSKTTDMLLFQSSFEITYYILFFIMFLTAGLTLIVSTAFWESDRVAKGSDYDSASTGAIIGMVNSIMYGISALWFLISHRYSQQTQSKASIG